jgi:hypothetical protein
MLGRASMKLTVATLLLLTSVAAAEDAAPTSTLASGYEIGARIGGYGFRREGDPTPGEGWTECRMNGFGVFGNKLLQGRLLVVACLDMYSSATGPVGGAANTNENDLPIDRTSGLISAAVGVRTNVTSWLGAYLQLGGGIELTHVSVPYGDTRIRDNKAMPEGFFGLGADIKIFRATRIGASFRTLVMGNFDYDPARLDMSNGWVSAPPSSEVFDASAGVAAQAQFYVRREL